MPKNEPPDDADPDVRHTSADSTADTGGEDADPSSSGVDGRPSWTHISGALHFCGFVIDDEARTNRAAKLVAIVMVPVLALIALATIVILLRPESILPWVLYSISGVGAIGGVGGAVAAIRRSKPARVGGSPGANEAGSRPDETATGGSEPPDAAPP